VQEGRSQPCNLAVDSEADDLLLPPSKTHFEELNYPERREREPYNSKLEGPMNPRWRTSGVH
jgi:hypothetical protein